MIMISREKALKMIKETGLENIWELHQRHAFALRQAVRALGLRLFVDDNSKASYAITSIYPPEGISVPDIRKVLKEDYDIVVANGQNALKDKIFRMGTLGFVSDRDLLTAVSSLEGTLRKLGYEFEIGSGVKALLNAL